jgi:hypothetical protein
MSTLKKPNVKQIMPGISTWTNQYNIDIFRLHYSADPEKDADWVAREKARCTSMDLWQQELEIDFYATEGSLLYHMVEAATVIPEVPLPQDWTRWMALDTHPVKPHAALWGAVSPHGDLHIYREFWPSKVYNRVGQVPDDENQYTIREFVKCLKYLESKDNPLNYGQDEVIFERVIDYAARGFGKGTNDAPTQSNFQKRFEDEMRDLGMRNWKFADAIKDHQSGEAEVNQWLFPRSILDPGKDDFVLKSKLQIHTSCPELLWQIRNNRRRNQTAIEAATKDPELKRVEKRNDLTDCLRYLVMAEPMYVHRSGRAHQSTLQPQYKGVSY